jgi:hypothetical protein
MSDRPTGALFTNSRKKKDNHPDYNGNIELDRELVEHLVEQIKSGTPKPKIDLAGWKKVSGNGTRYLSLAPSIPFELTERGKEYYKNKGDTPSTPPVNDPNDLDEIPF